MSKLTVGSIEGLASEGYKISVASGSQIVQAGAVLQVVNATTSTEVSTTSTSYVTTNLSASITPSSTSSKVLALVSIPTMKQTDAVWSGVFVALFRGTVSGTMLVENEFYVEKPVLGQTSYSWLDSPNTTSAQTYTVGVKVNSTLITGIVCRSGRTGTLTLMEIAG